VYLSRLKVFFLLGVLFSSLLHSSELDVPTSNEAQLIQSMLLYAFKGTWYPMTNKIMPYDEFVLKGGKLYRESDDIPFTGWYAQFDQKDEPRLLCTFADGQKNGFSYLWDENGTRRFQGEYKANLQNGEFFEWNEHHQVVSQKNYLAGKLHGEYRLWYGSGKLKLEAFFQNGKLLDAQGWLPGGIPCPYSKVINGRGVILSHYEKTKKASASTLQPSIIAEVLDELNLDRNLK
jgi:antitoxin component YwqK of YwqJK toxin-antitoxin module